MIDAFIEYRQVNAALFDSVNIILKAVNTGTELKKYDNKGQSVDGRASYSPVSWKLTVFL
jgi:hypothetical protein